MANVLFTRDSLTNIENPSLHPVTDGQLLFDTSGSGKMYMDVGTQRLEMGGAMTIDSKLNSTSTNPIQNKAVGGVMLSTLDEINAATSKGFITDALATRALAQKIGTTDISSIGDGTCTGAISALNASKIDRSDIKSTTGKAVKIISDSKAWSIGSNPVDTIGLYTVGEIASMFGINNFNWTKFTFIINNGDYAARQFYVVGAYIDNNGILQVKLNTTVSYSLRFNFTFFYVM